ncbi:MAG: hypothetical protein FWC43_05865, partial [Planctomycetaceae bacterium]|nr:hypothetical protein [Planctomycetaceae bacterium]
MFHKFFGRENISQGAKKTRNSLVNLSIEPLEERQMLAITGLIGGVSSSVSAGETALLSLNIDSSATAAIGITVNATNEGGKLDPAAIRLIDSDGNALASSKYLYDFNGKDSSTVVVNLPSGSYQIQVAGENGSYGSFTCDVFMPGVGSSAAGTGTGAVSQLDALRATTAAAQGNGNFNEQTIAYYNALATSMGYSKLQFNAAQSQYNKYFDINDDGIVSAAEASWVSTNAGAGTVAVTLNATAEIIVNVGVTHWLTSDTATVKTKTAVLDISGSVSSNVVKLEAKFEGNGASTSWADITSKLGVISGGVKAFQLDDAWLNWIYYRNDTDALPPGTYTIKFLATTGDEKQAPKEVSYTFTLVAHQQPESKTPAAQTLYPVDTNSFVEWNVVDLVGNADANFRYMIHSVVAYGTTYSFALNSAGDAYNPITVTDGGTTLGTLTYTGGTKGADGHFYGGKLVFKPTAAQVALSKGAADIAVNFNFVVQDDSAVTGQNRTAGDKSINVTVHPVNKTPIVSFTGAKTTFDPNSSTYTYKLAGTSDANSAVIATDANTADKLTFTDSVVVTVNGTALTATGTAGANKVWTTAQGTVITLVWDAASSSYTELKITPTTSAVAVAEAISIKFTVKDDAGVTIAANGDQVSETALQTLAITVNGVTAKPVVTGNDLTITAAQAAAGNIVTGWQATGTGITKYEIGKSGTTLQTITLGGTVTVSGVGTFKLENDGKLTWVTVDPAFIPTSGGADISANFVFQATNSDGTTTLTKKLTVTADSSVVFSNQTLYLPTNGVAVAGMISSGGALVYSAPTGTNVAFTIESAKDKNGNTVNVSNFTVTADGHILVDESDLASLNAGPYKLQIKANFTGAVTDVKTAEITLYIEAGTPATLGTGAASIGEKATVAVETTVTVTVPSGVNWEIVNGNLSGSVQVSAHGDTTAYVKTLTPGQIAALFAKAAVVQESNGFKGTFTPDAEFTSIFQFLSEGQTAKLVFTYQVRENRYGLISEGTVTLTVNGKNDQPVRGAVAEFDANEEEDAVPVDSTDGVKIYASDLLALFTDADLADKHFFVVDGVSLKVDGDTVTLESGATLIYVEDADGDYLLYVPNGDETDSPFYSAQHGALVTDKFDLYVKDDSGATNATSTAAVEVTVNLTGVNKTPYFNNTSVITKTVKEDAATTFTINIGDIATDPNTGDVLTFGTIIGPNTTTDVFEVDPTKATQEFEVSTGSIIRVTNNGKTLTIIPSTDKINLRQFNGDETDVEGVTWRTETYKFSVKDDQNLANSESAVSKELGVTITGVNEAPVGEDFVQDVSEAAAITAWASTRIDPDPAVGYDYSKWIKIDWQDKIYDPDINETDMLWFSINGNDFYLLEKGKLPEYPKELALPKGTFVILEEVGKLVLRFRPATDYSYLAEGESETLSFNIQVTDPYGATLKDGPVTLDIVIHGDDTMTVGEGLQTFFVATGDPLTAYQPIKFYSNEGDDIDVSKLSAGTIGFKNSETVPQFGGFSFEQDADGNIFVGITPNTDLDDDFEAQFGSALQEGDILVYKVPLNYDGDPIGYVYVSVYWGEAPETLLCYDYKLTVSEKHLTSKDRPYAPPFPEGYTVGKITPLLPADFDTKYPATASSKAELQDVIDNELLEGVHYGIEDGRFWFDPKGLFFFLRQDQTAEIVFNIPLYNEYGLPTAGASGTITVIVTGVNDRPEAVDKDAGEVWANGTMQVKIADLFTDKDIDDAHSIIVYDEDGVELGVLAEDGDTVTLPSGATLTYKEDPVNGDYLEYAPNHVAGNKFYSLQSGRTLEETVTFRIKDDSNMANSESKDTAELTFTVKGVNKTPVVDSTKLNQTVDSDKSITIRANELATDANTGDVLSFVSIQYGTNAAWTTAGTYDIKDTDGVLLGTLVIAADMQSFTFTPELFLADPELGGLTPYDPADPDSFLNLNFVFVIKDDAGIAVGDPNEQPSVAVAATLNLQIQGVSQGPRLKNPDFFGSIANSSTATGTKYLDAGYFFSGKNVVFKEVELLSALPPYDDDTPGYRLTFLRNIESLAVEASGTIKVEYMSSTQYCESYNLSPVRLLVTVVDEDGVELTEEIRLNCQEQYTTKVYLRPSLVPLDNWNFGAENFPVNFETEYDADSPFEVNVGQTYYLQIWARDDSTDLLNQIESAGLSAGFFDISYDSSVVSINKRTNGSLNVTFIEDASITERGTIIAGTKPNEEIISNIGCTAPTDQVAGFGLGLPPKGWIIVQIAVTADAVGTPDFKVLLESLNLQVDRFKPIGVSQKDKIHQSQIQVVNPVIVHKDTSLLTALTQQEKEVDGGIYMRTVTTPTETRADGTVASLPKDANMLHEWQSHYVELWVKASEADKYIAAKTDLHYDTRYFTAVSVELGQDFRYGDKAVIDDPNGVVYGIGGASAGTVSKDGYVLLGRVLFQSIGKDNVPWNESGIPHSLGLKLANGGVRMSEGYWVSRLGGGSKTELWANPYDYNDDGTISVVDFSAFAKEFVFSKEGELSFSPFNVSRTGQVSITDFTSFAANFGTTREQVVSGQKELKLHANYTKRYIGSTLQADNQALVGAMLDAANQAWADALGLAKPIDVTLVVKDFGDS